MELEYDAAASRLGRKTALGFLCFNLSFCCVFLAIKAGILQSRHSQEERRISVMQTAYNICLSRSNLPMGVTPEAVPLQFKDLCRKAIEAHDEEERRESAETQAKLNLEDTDEIEKLRLLLDQGASP